MTEADAMSDTVAADDRGAVANDGGTVADDGCAVWVEAEAVAVVSMVSQAIAVSS